MYDYVIIGGGMGGLTAGALLANAGASVAVLEAHEFPGGCCHTFPMGRYRFCAAVHYIFSCGEGEPVHNVLRKLGLEETVTFERLDPEGFDHFSCPSEGMRFRIPNGLGKWSERLADRFPEERAGIAKFFGTVQTLWTELQLLPDELRLLDVPKAVLQSPHVLRYRRWTLQRLFDSLGLSKPVQAILSTQLGDLGLPPSEVSLLIYVALVSRYGDGAYYPTEHFSHFIDAFADAITRSPGSTLSLNTEVTAAKMEGGRLRSVTTADGREFRGTHFICNADPQWFVSLVGREQFPQKYLQSVDYEYSASSFSVYLGVRGIDLRDHGFGNWNVWHYPRLDVNDIYAAQHRRDDLGDPWLFMSTPTLCSPRAKTLHAPEGEQILELITTCAYEPFERAQKTGLREYTRRKVALRDRMIATVERHYVPNLRRHLAIRVAGTPTTNRRYLWAPGGNIYGSALTPENVSERRLKWRTPVENLFFTGASAAFPSIGGTVSGAARLYTALTGDSLSARRGPTGQLPFRNVPMNTRSMVVSAGNSRPPTL